MKIIAIDPGYDRVGIAILEKDIEKVSRETSTQNQREQVVMSMCIQTSKKDDFYTRMTMIRETLQKVISEFEPQYAVLEEIYFSKNTKTAMRVAEARGVILGECLRNQLQIQEIHPNKVKVAITGYGSAKKEDILFMIPKLVSCETHNKLDDELDAIAIGITFFAEFHSYGLR